MRIETIEHSAYGKFEQFVVRDFFDVIVLDAAEHIGKGAHLFERQFVTAGAGGQHPLTDGQRATDYGTKQYQCG